MTVNAAKHVCKELEHAGSLGIFQWSSAIVTKHLNILTCNAYTMPKERSILGALTV